MECQLLHKLVRRKQREGNQQRELSRDLRLHQLVAIGVGTTIGAGIFILIGTVAKQRTGPALPLSFLVAGIAAAFSALNYAELSSRLPSAGSAYHYAYTCLGEGVAWLVGWSIILEYTVSGATVARGVSPNMALFFGEKLPVWLVRHRIPGTDILADPFAGLLVILTTIVLCTGIKQSAGAQIVMTSLLVFVLSFVDVTGVWVGFKTGWKGYELEDGYIPFGVNGVLSGAATLFFSYVGFDALASTAEEVKNPQRDLPLGIGIALFLCASLYMSVSAVVVGIVPYYSLNPDTPISSAFMQNGLPWASYVIALGALVAMLTTLLGCFLPQPRILMTMARDGLLPPFFSKIHTVTSIPVNSAIVTGGIATVMTVFMNVEQLSEMVSVGTLIAFTSAGICILVIRYVPPRPDAVSSSFIGPDDEEARLESSSSKYSFLKEEESGPSRQIRSFSISCVVLGSLMIGLFLTVSVLPWWIRWIGAAVGGATFAIGSIALLIMKQDESHSEFGNAGGFLCPFVPLLPIMSILINIYLLLNVGPATWIRVTIWIGIGTLIYLFYGIRHSVHTG